MTVVRPILRVTEVGEYIRHRSCQRRFKLEINHRRIARRLPFADRLFNTLDPVLRQEGWRRESEWERSLQQAGLTRMIGPERLPDGDEEHPGWEAFVGAASGLSPGTAGYGREVAVVADIGAFRVQGRIDFAVILWRAGQPVLRLVECKASRKDRSYHRIQASVYALVVDALLRSQPLVVSGVPVHAVECVVARIDETTNESQAILELPPLDLAVEAADVTRLLAPDGPLAYIVAAELDELNYELDAKCDGCVFNVDCLPESARLRRHELIGVSASTARALRAAGVATLDDLAQLDLNGQQANQLREDTSFTEHLDRLSTLARVRRRTLPGGDADPDTFQVESLPQAPPSQLPEHLQGAQRLVRVYMVVDYDYTENRVGALSAHVTSSDWPLYTGFVQTENRWAPDPWLRERRETARTADGERTYEDRPVAGQDVIRYKGSEWTGDHRQDTGAERELIQGFVRDLIDTIAEVAGTDAAPIHFYVWSRSEMAQLVEACSRATSRLLGALRELMGCRETLEQLMYSCLQEEVDRRYALGWTGRGLVVASSLRWFGQTYHWRRLIGGREVDLDRVFTQDIFDFKTDLDLRADGEWARNERERASRHKFEIRTRFHDSLPAPYWRAVWGALPDPDGADVSGDVRNAIRRYNLAAEPNHLREYLRARTHALRWIDERVRFKNPEIAKPAVSIPEIRRFSLGVDNAAQAAIDFLRLDQHVKASDWIAEHMVAPAARVPAGRTIPLADVISQGDLTLTARINLDGYGMNLATLQARSPFGEGSMVRLVPHSGDPHQGQTIGQLTRGGRTCTITTIDWDTGQVTLSEMWSNATRYVLHSGTTNETGTDVFEHATIDDSVSDFVAGRVEARLLSGCGTYVFRWFDPENPQVPPRAELPAERLTAFREFLTGLRLPDNAVLAPDQVGAVLDGIEARVQLLQGPPGTGKTVTTAVAMLMRIGQSMAIGDVVLVTAHTHTAVNNLLTRTGRILDAFREQARAAGLAIPPVVLAKVQSSNRGQDLDGVLNFVAQPSAKIVNEARERGVVVIGGTTSAQLKLGGELSRRRPWSGEADGFKAKMLIVDEASMMVFPHFLSSATFVAADGEIMLTGDHRQLSPIVAHDWEREDRPPAVLYQPFASAYDAVRDIAAHPVMTAHAVRRSSLQLSFRLPPVIVELLARLYRLDAIELEGLPRQEATAANGGGGWETVWQGASGLFLVLHNERRSRQSNELEAEVIRSILEAGGQLVAGSVALITPHRAQRSLLKLRLAAFEGPVDVIDTVERMQGGERPVVIVSGTASDDSVISLRTEFLLDLNRSNVAFSRAKDRLIVVCSQSLLDHVPPELEHYQSAMLWKALRALCSLQVARFTLGPHDVRILTPPLEAR